MNRFRKRRKRNLMVAIVCLAMLCNAYDAGMFTISFQVQAAKKDDLKNQNEEDKEKLDDIDNKLNELEEEQEGIDEEIQALSDEIAELMASSSLLEENIKIKKEEIVQAKLDVAEAIRVERAQYENMKARIKDMYENGETSYLDIFLGATSMQDMMNKADYIERMHEYDRKMYTNYQNARQTVEAQQQRLEMEEANLEEAEEGLKEEMSVIETAKAELEKISSDYTVQISKAKQQAEIYKAQIKQRNSEIQKIEEEERRAEEARKKAEEEARKKAEAEAKKNTNNTKNTNNNTATTPSTSTGTAAVDKNAIMSAPGSTKGKEIAIYACSFVGNPYVSGGTSLTNGADCSGFTQSVYKAFGYSIPRTSTSQRTAGREVSYAEAEPGDIICYPGHVAIYIGNGKIVHASTVKTGIKISNASYNTILGVRRII